MLLHYTTKPLNRQIETYKRISIYYLSLGAPGAPCLFCMTGIPGMFCIGPEATFVAQYGQNAQRSSSSRSHLGQGRLSF